MQLAVDAERLKVVVEIQAVVLLIVVGQDVASLVLEAMVAPSVLVAVVEDRGLERGRVTLTDCGRLASLLGTRIKVWFVIHFTLATYMSSPKAESASEGCHGS